MKIDDSFKKPGAVPFKWEIRPGVPKLQDSPRTPQHKKSQIVQQELSPFNSPRLKPPPAGFQYFHPQQEPRSQSFRSAPNTPSRRFRVLSGPEIVSSVGCFLSPMLKRKLAKKSKNRKDGLEPEYASDVETSSRWSVSSRRSVSPLPHSFHSERMSSPHPVSDAEWAALTLF